jgi:hypothetical protein
LAIFHLPFHFSDFQKPFEIAPAADELGAQECVHELDGE